MAVTRFSGTTTVAGATVTVYLDGSQVHATIYSDALQTPLSNPFTSDIATGRYIFYADDAISYDITETTDAGTPLPVGNSSTFAFGVVEVASQDLIEADKPHDVLGVAAGLNVTLETDPDTKVLTISASSGSGTPSNTVAALDGTGVAGAATTYSRGDHRHADANRPTDDEKAAMAGISTPPSAANPFATEDDIPTGGGNVTSTGAFASPPGSPAAGDLFFPNNSYVMERYSGSGWVPWGPLFPITYPNDADFSWVNQGGASVVTNNAGIYLSAPPTTGEDWHLRVMTAPSTPWTMTGLFLPSANFSPSTGMGFVYRESGTGKFVHVGVAGNAPFNWAVNNYTDPTHYTSTPVSGIFLAFGPVWWKLQDDGANRIISLSGDGQNFIQLYSVARTTFMTADQVGFVVNAGSGTYTVGMTVLSWKLT